MNTRFLNALVILFLIGSISCSKVAVHKIEKMKQSQNSDAVGQTLLTTVQLQLTTGGSVDNIIRLLEELVNDLQEDQEEADADYAEQNAYWDEVIEWAEDTIDVQEQRQNDLEREIQILNGQIDETERNIAINQQQIVAVNQKIEDLTAAREADEEATQVRVDRQSEMLKAVNYIIDELENMIASESFLQLPQIKQTLQKLVKSNPLQALVQLTMTFNVDSVQYAVNKLEDIREALVASLQDEAEQEEDAEEAFQDLLKKMVVFQQNAHEELEENQAELAELEEDLSDAESDLEDTEDYLEVLEAYLSDNQNSQKSYNVAYAVERAEREREVEIIENVIDILQDGSESANAAEANEFTSDD